MRLNNSNTAVCLAYFPNDGVTKAQTDAIMFELLKNTTDLQALGYEAAIMVTSMVDACKKVNFPATITYTNSRHATVNDYYSSQKPAN